MLFLFIVNSFFIHVEDSFANNFVKWLFIIGFIVACFS